VRTAFAGTGGGKDREDNKRITFDEGIIMPRGNLEMAREVFRCKDGIHADPVEATECAMMVRDHQDKLITSNYHRPGVVREFDIVKYSSPVVFPERYPAKKAEDRKKTARKRAASAKTERKPTKKQKTKS
jgi:hypothetical protein